MKMSRVGAKKLHIAIAAAVGTAIAFGTMAHSVQAVSVISRESIPFDETLSDQEQNVYAPVEAVSVVKISPPPGLQFGDGESWIQGLYYYSITELGFADIPFNYIVTWRGEVFEAKGGGPDVAPHVDWESSSGISSSAVIAYFDNNQEMTNSGRAGIVEIVSEVLSQYGLSAGDVAPVDARIASKAGETILSKLVLSPTEDQAWRDIIAGVQEDVTITPQTEASPVKGSVEGATYSKEVDAGKNFIATVRIKNEGERPWYSSGENRVLVATSDPRNEDSRFFVTDKWASFTRVGSASEEWVLSGEVGTFEFEMNTPMIPGEYSQKFELLLLPDRWIDGTQFEVAFSVGKGDFELVEILETETGYLNVRDCPSQGCAELGQVAPGDILIKKDYQDGWYQVEMEDGEPGWVYGKYAKEI